MAALAKNMRRSQHVYREHVTPVWRYVRAHVPSDPDAEDVTSEVFTQAMRSWNGYDSTRGPVGAWLTGIARNCLAGWWRKNGQEFPAGDAHPDSPAPDDPEALALSHVGDDNLRRFLGQLTAKEREAVALRFGSEMTSEQIGATMGISATAARMLVYRAVGKLREVMK